MKLQLKLKLESLPRRAIGAAMLIVATAPAFAAEANTTYDVHCAMCHQKAGAGLKGQFPRLAGRAAQIGGSADGRRFLIEVTLYGMAGKIDIDGATLFGVMPSFAQLQDEDLASVLRYIMALEGPEKNKPLSKPPTIEAADIAKVRSGPALNATQVFANRARVVPKDRK